MQFSTTMRPKITKIKAFFVLLALFVASILYVLFQIRPSSTQAPVDTSPTSTPVNIPVTKNPNLNNLKSGTFTETGEIIGLDKNFGLVTHADSNPTIIHPGPVSSFSYGAGVIAAL